MPTYRLYADGGGVLVPLADVLHVEAIAERSSLHAWEIRPHRHTQLLQIFHIAGGGVDVDLDGRQHRLRGPAVIVMPPLAVHGFRWTTDVQGTVFSVQFEHLRLLLRRDPALAAAAAAAQCMTLARSEARTVAAAVQALQHEATRTLAHRASAIDAALLGLLVLLVRCRPVQAAPRPEPGRAGAASERLHGHVRALQAQVDARFREHPTVARLAAGIGITPAQLNRACLSVLGHGAQGVLHSRLLLEAQRELAYTTLPLRAVAERLGFADAAYFSRFFARRCGLPPGAWRSEHQRG